MKHVFETDLYFQNIPTHRNATMFILRELIFEIYPSIEEQMIDGYPTYFLDDQAICSLISTPRSMAIKILPSDLLMAFESELENYNWESSYIRFEKIEQKDFDLFEQILKFVGYNYTKSAVSKRPTKTVQELIEI